MPPTVDSPIHLKSKDNSRFVNPIVLIAGETKRLLDVIPLPGPPVLVYCTGLVVALLDI